MLGRCLDRGLAADGRLVRFVVTVSDRPGAIAGVTQLVASVGADVKDIFYERAWLFSSVFSVQVMHCMISIGIFVYKYLFYSEDDT